ncbi:hypothetical protein [Microbulbifer sp. THAF38]|uniref:hypothetical protein n=1 Tax=Microbulbifer sp. THAF38 TaxID=2587856 RepID=UPI001268B8A7|nr:hypothetical protein [Microbulbifer sp. THAF38]QFT57067.1 hypothetical protein FIU95_21180 [Microbulbifer sp. THAF38]
MTVFGIPFRKPDQKDLLVISLIILGMLAISIPLADAIEVKPQTLLAMDHGWSFWWLSQCIGYPGN